MVIVNKLIIALLIIYMQSIILQYLSSVPDKNNNKHVIEYFLIYRLEI